MWSVTSIAFLCASHLNGILTESEDLLTKFKNLENSLLSALETHVQRINKLEEIVKQQQDKLSDQEKTMIQQQQAMTEQHKLYKTLQNMYNKQAGIIKRHENIMHSQAARIFSLEKDKDLSSMVARTSNTSSGPGQDNTKHKTKMYRAIDKRACVHSDNKVVRRHSSGNITTPVAFTAVKYTKQAGIGINQNIAFDHIILNDGGGFHALHSIFIAPVAGYYLFSTSTLHSMDIPHCLHAGLLHNGNVIAILESLTMEP